MEGQNYSQFEVQKKLFFETLPETFPHLHKGLHLNKAAYTQEEFKEYTSTVFTAWALLQQQYKGKLGDIPSFYYNLHVRALSNRLEADAKGALTQEKLSLLDQSPKIVEAFARIIKTEDHDFSSEHVMGLADVILPHMLWENARVQREINNPPSYILSEKDADSAHFLIGRLGIDITEMILSIRENNPKLLRFLKEYIDQCPRPQRTQFADGVSIAYRMLTEKELSPPHPITDSIYYDAVMVRPPMTRDFIYGKLPKEIYETFVMEQPAANKSLGVLKQKGGWGMAFMLGANLVLHPYALASRAIKEA